MEEFEKRAKERAAREKEMAEEDEARALGNSLRSSIPLKMLLSRKPNCPTSY